MLKIVVKQKKQREKMAIEVIELKRKGPVGEEQSDFSSTKALDTIKKLNEKCLNETIVFKHDPSNKSGFEKKRRYEWEP